MKRGLKITSGRELKVAVPRLEDGWPSGRPSLQWQGHPFALLAPRRGLARGFLGDLGRSWGVWQLQKLNPVFRLQAFEVTCK